MVVLDCLYLVFLHFVLFAFCHICILLHLYFVSFAFCYNCIMSYLHFVTFAICPICILLHSHFVWFPFCLFLTFCYICILSILHFVMDSPAPFPLRGKGLFPYGLVTKVLLRDAFNKRVYFGTLSQRFLSPILPQLFVTCQIGTRWRY